MRLYGVAQDLFIFSRGAAGVFTSSCLALPKEGLWMITGHDTVLVARGPVNGMFASLLDDLSVRWPDLRFSALPPGHVSFSRWRGQVSDLPEDRADLLVAVDEGMLDHWEECGYELRGDGCGPFGVLYRPAPWSTLPIKFIADPYEHGIGIFEPYDGILVGGGYHLVTVVTPDEDSEFSQQLLRSITRHMGTA
ncbi:hypothetical protein [Micromonospora sp. SL4-19]|uniref:hypothetical protein n=1 Tax=Micromonospora sp. SL4-19 TaxID=3399129 RepID=UPI003A4D3788